MRTELRDRKRGVSRRCFTPSKRYIPSRLPDRGKCGDVLLVTHTANNIPVFFLPSHAAVGPLLGVRYT